MNMAGYRGCADQEQLALGFTHDRQSMETALGDMAGRAVALAVTDNSVSVLSVRRGSGGLRVRLHRMFLEAGPEVIREIGAFITGRVRKTPLTREYVRARSQALSQGRPRSLKLQAAGRWHDLNDIFGRLNAQYFGGRVEAVIGWGARSSRRAVRRRTLGSYCRRTHRIRINPALDSPRVPVFFVEFVVYHEMLHADMGAVRIGGRTCVHTREFRERERCFRQYERATGWERARYQAR